MRPMAELNFGRLLRRSRLYADAEALVDLETDHRATHSEHLGRVERLCAVIAGLGVGPADRIGVLAGNSHVYIELWHAALAGSAVINPLNTRLAPEEIVYILTDSATEVVFTDAAHAGTIASVRERLPLLRKVVLIGAGDALCDERLDDLMAATPAGKLPSEPDPRAPCVLMYTGGTTGLPKGVVLDQRAIALVISRMRIGLGSDSRVSFLACMPLFHIGGIGSWGIFLPTGGRSVVIPAFEPGRVNALVRDHEITATGLVPTMLAMMLEHEDFEPEMLASLRLVMYGAAPMPPELLEKLMKLYPQLRFYQAYGMTECASTVTALLPEDHAEGGELLRSVGRPCVGVEVEIRDPESAEPLPHGATGEIWLRCDSTMVEYWNKPEQTRSSLVEGWYRTGDAGRLGERGHLFLADRVKDMIVTGGENVYSIEVENAISSHPAVRQVAVVGVPHPQWGEVVHAVVVCGPGSVSEEELDAHARRSIAGYKVPKGWTLQNDPLPLSAANKVLKRDLRERLKGPREG
jgi:acyl-CoA synthetase (AMP-forming)/AMP-acid ligase II